MKTAKSQPNDIKPKALVLSGLGINCEEETKFAFELAGAQADVIHVNDLIADKSKLKNYEILAFPGGFSFGDDTGSGRAFANLIRNHLLSEIQEFIKGDKLIIGICNGFQVLCNLGLLPGALVHNDGARFLDRWVDIKVQGNSPWLQGLESLSLPIAHGEGKFYADTQSISRIKSEFDDFNTKSSLLTYTQGEITKREGLPANPNGSMADIAGLTSKDGKILGLMPHPERAIFFHHLPHWTYLREEYRRSSKPVPEYGPGLVVFQNAVKYFSESLKSELSTR